MKTIKSILILLILLTLYSCANNSGTDNSAITALDTTVNQVDNNVDNGVETNRSQVKDSLPDKLDFGGITIRILGRDDGTALATEIAAPENTGDVVEDAVYRRNITVEERLNIVIEPQYVNQNVHGGEQINGLLRKSVLAGDNEYDIAANHMSQFTPLILEGCLINLNKLDYIDFDQPWWNQSFKEQIEVDNKLYFAVGDISLTMTKAMYTSFINLDMFTDNFPNDNIYDVVLDGNWTLPKMQEYCKAAYRDLNGNGVYDIEDQFGYMVNKGIHTDAMLGAANVHFIDNSGDTPIFVLDSERTYQFVEAYSALLFSDNCSFLTTDGDDKYILRFKNGNSLFTTFMLSGADEYRDMEDDYGMLPLPKLNDSQSEYTGWTHNGFSAFAIVNTTDKPDMAACVLEAMSAESYRYVTEAYFDVALKVKYARDDISSQMLDLIQQSIVFDFGMVYSASLENVMQLFREISNAPGFNTASKIATKLSVSQVKLEQLLEKYDALE